jgi:hypothetical protein
MKLPVLLQGLPRSLPRFPPVPLHVPNRRGDPKQSVKRGQNRRELRGLKVTSSQTVSHLFFIDDVWVNIFGSLRDVSSLSKSLDLFYKATGMKINLDKSCLLTIFSQRMKLPLFFAFYLSNTNLWMRG